MSERLIDSFVFTLTTIGGWTITLSICLALILISVLLIPRSKDKENDDKVKEDAATDEGKEKKVTQPKKSFGIRIVEKLKDTPLVIFFLVISMICSLFVSYILFFSNFPLTAGYIVGKQTTGSPITNIGLDSLQKGTTIGGHILDFLWVVFSKGWLAIIVFVVFIFLMYWISLYAVALRKASTISHKVLAFFVSFGQALGKTWNALVSTAKTLLIILLISVLMVIIGEATSSAYTAYSSLSRTVAAIRENQEKIQENEQKIKALKTAVKNLSLNRALARIVVINRGKDGSVTFVLFFYDPTSNDPVHFASAQKVITMPDDHLYIDCAVWNFDYSAIADGVVKNIAIPYRLFSEHMAPDNGIMLTDRDGVFLAFKRKAKDIYGMEEDLYNKTISDLSKTLQNPNIMKEQGIMMKHVQTNLQNAPEEKDTDMSVSNMRTAYGDAVHRKIEKGYWYTLYVNGTGGVTMKQTKMTKLMDQKIFTLFTSNTNVNVPVL